MSHDGNNSCQSNFGGNFDPNIDGMDNPLLMPNSNINNIMSMNGNHILHNHHSSDVYSSSQLMEAMNESNTRSGDLRDIYGSNMYAKQRSFRIHTPFNHYPKTCLPSKQRNHQEMMMNQKRKNLKTSTPTKTNVVGAGGGSYG